MPHLLPASPSSSPVPMLSSSCQGEDTNSKRPFQEENNMSRQASSFAGHSGSEVAALQSMLRLPSTSPHASKSPMANPAINSPGDNAPPNRNNSEADKEINPSSRDAMESYDSEKSLSRDNDSNDLVAGGLLSLANATRHQEKQDHYRALDKENIKNRSDDMTLSKPSQSCWDSDRNSQFKQHVRPPSLRPHPQPPNTSDDKGTESYNLDSSGTPMVTPTPMDGYPQNQHQHYPSSHQDPVQHKRLLPQSSPIVNSIQHDYPCYPSGHAHTPQQPQASPHSQLPSPPKVHRQTEQGDTPTPQNGNFQNQQYPQASPENSRSWQKNNIRNSGPITPISGFTRNCNPPQKNEGQTVTGQVTSPQELSNNGPPPHQSPNQCGIRSHEGPDVYGRYQHPAAPSPSNSSAHYPPSRPQYSPPSTHGTYHQPHQHPHHQYMPPPYYPHSRQHYPYGYQHHQSPSMHQSRGGTEHPPSTPHPPHYGHPPQIHHPSTPHPPTPYGMHPSPRSRTFPHSPYNHHSQQPHHHHPQQAHSQYLSGPPQGHSSHSPAHTGGPQHGPLPSSQMSRLVSVDNQQAVSPYPGMVDKQQQHQQINGGNGPPTPNSQFNNKDNSPSPSKKRRIISPLVPGTPTQCSPPGPSPGSAGNINQQHCHQPSSPPSSMESTPQPKSGPVYPDARPHHPMAVSSYHGQPSHHPHNFPTSPPNPANPNHHHPHPHPHNAMRGGRGSPTHRTCAEESCNHPVVHDNASLCQWHYHQSSTDSERQTSNPHLVLSNSGSGSAEINSVAQWQQAQMMTGFAPSANKCVPLKSPIPSKFWGDVQKVKDSFVPDFHRLVNFPDYLPKNRPPPGDGMRCCVMCGRQRLCTASTSKGNSKNQGDSLGSPGNQSYGNNDTSPLQSPSLLNNSNSGALTNSSSTRSCCSPTHIIPRQNKGLCTACDVTVWVVTATGLEIKWCKGCKNFRPWAAFGDKGLATKCVRCRDRQREKYATQKENLKMKRRQNGCCPSPDGSVVGDGSAASDTMSHVKAAAQGGGDLEGNANVSEKSGEDEEQEIVGVSRGLSNLLAATNQVNE